MGALAVATLWRSRATVGGPGTVRTTSNPSRRRSRGARVAGEVFDFDVICVRWQRGDGMAEQLHPE